MKQKYMQEVRKKMFWQFSADEIEEVLGDIDIYFEEAAKEEISNEQFVKCYGTPQELVAELVDLQSISCKQKIRQIFLKIAYLVFCVLGIILTAIFCKQEVAVLFNLILCAALLWFISGCRYSFKNNVNNTKKNRGLFLQILFWTICIAMQLCALFIVPFLLEKVQNVMEFGPILYLVIYVCILILGVVTIICIKKVLNGNVNMFILVIESISLLYSLYLYSVHIKYLTSLENASFVFYPCVFAVIILLAFRGFYL